MNETELLKMQIEALKQLSEIQKQSIQQLMEQVSRLQSTQITYPNPQIVQVPYNPNPYSPWGQGGTGGILGGSIIGGTTGTIVVNPGGAGGTTTTGTIAGNGCNSNVSYKLVEFAV